MKNEDCIKLCNGLLAGERSAVEAYDIAIKKFSDIQPLVELSAIRNEHVKAVQALDERITQMGGESEDSSGIWGTFVKGIQHTANLFGEESAIESLIKGEEFGLDEYEVALKQSYLEPDCRLLIQTKLIPKIQEHLVLLDKLEEIVD
ncbi:MAG: DUF2383 domain-containing protein [Akkermansiaceae bacterium]